MHSLHHVLWTGGFDSTFRVCQLLIEQEHEVQPIYATHMGFQEDLIFDSYDCPNDIQKPAMPHEMQALAKIRTTLGHDFPGALSRLRPICFIPSRRANDDWVEGKKILGPGINRGRQYNLLRLVALQYQHPIELCIERSPPGHNSVGDALMPWVERDGDIYRLREDLPDQLLDLDSTQCLANFQHFRFPLLHVSRQDMMQMARTASYNHILEQTWSCRDQRPNRKPCGICFCCQGRRRDKVFWPNPLGV